MSRKYKFLNQEQAYFVSFAVIHWIDVFTRKIYCDKLVESLKYCQKEKGLILYAWCIMPSHVHLLMGTKKELMQNILRDFKSFTSRTIRKEILSHPKESRKEWMMEMMIKTGLNNGNNKDWQFWQQNNHPIELSSNKIINQKLEYLHFNPVVAGYVESPEDWLYSSAKDYYGKQGLLEVELIY
jgi:REP element-mobilizing transposase RayT